MSYKIIQNIALLARNNSKIITFFQKHRNTHNIFKIEFFLYFIFFRNIKLGYFVYSTLTFI